MLPVSSCVSYDGVYVLGLFALILVGVGLYVWIERRGD